MFFFFLETTQIEHSFFKIVKNNQMQTFFVNSIFILSIDKFETFQITIQNTYILFFTYH